MNKQCKTVVWNEDKESELDIHDIISLSSLRKNKTGSDISKCFWQNNVKVHNLLQTMLYKCLGKPV